MMQRRIATVVAVVGLIVAGWCVYDRHKDSSVHPVTPSRITQDQASFIESGINSHDKAKQTSALVPALRNSAWDPSTLVANGATLRLDPSSFVADGLGGAHITTQMSGVVTCKYTLTLAYINNQWFFVSSTKQ